MLETISVSGFRSLENFYLRFNRGINVLVGPNGSGKTNIINFIEFVSYLSQNTVLDAVGKAGGAGRIFRRNQSGGLVRSIKFKLTGSGSYTLGYRRPGEVRIKYELDVEISLSDKNSSVHYTSQRIKIGQLGTSAELDLDIWDFDAEFKQVSDSEPDIIFHKYSSEYLDDIYITRKREKSTEVIIDEMRQIAKAHGKNSIICGFWDRYVPSCNAFLMDLQNARSFNISPTVVRTPEDIASEPGISPDGRGLAPTLFFLKDGGDLEFKSYLPHMYYGIHNNIESISLNKIIELSKIVNDSIVGIDVEPDTIENKLRIFITTKYNDSNIRIPFSMVSDGTAKWFALVTAIIGSRSIFAVEEPENYLHPLMQREIVRIIRNIFEHDIISSFSIMTTHSETILNSIYPEEMIIVQMIDGVTKVHRPINAEDIRHEIEETGFGAGYYYLAGAIE